MVSAPDIGLARRLLLIAAALGLAACSPAGESPAAGGEISGGGATAPTAPSGKLACPGRRL